jgi:hypothetical protein
MPLGIQAQTSDRLVTLTVTVDSHKNQAPPAVAKEEVLVHHQKERIKVVDWKPASGPLNFYILVDDGLDSSAGSYLGEIAAFIHELPAQTRVAVGYASNGSVSVAQDFTEDKDAAAKALRIPRGSFGAVASPFLALNDLVKRFPDAPERREILFVSSGYDPMGGNDPSNPYVSTAIDNAQRRNIQVYSVYASAASHRGSHFFAVSMAQSNLAKVADETGGDSFYMGFGSPVSFKPFLDEVLQALSHQYILQVAIPEGKKANWVNLKINTEATGVEFDYAAKVWVP